MNFTSWEIKIIGDSVYLRGKFELNTRKTLVQMCWYVVGSAFFGRAVQSEMGGCKVKWSGAKWNGQVENEMGGCKVKWAGAKQCCPWTAKNELLLNWSDLILNWYRT